MKAGPSPGGRLWSLSGGAIAALVMLSLFAPLLAPQDPFNPLGFDPLAANHPPAWSPVYLLGADQRGRGVLALLLWGGRVSLAIGVGSALLAAVLGVAIGSLWHWRQGTLEPVLSFAMALFEAAPPLIVLMLLAARLGGVPLPLIVITFALTGWIGPARITRSTLQGAMNAPYIDAARALGVSERRVLLVHVLPAVIPPIAAWLASAAATYMAIEAGLDFLGLGLPAGEISWGTALVGARDALLSGNWWWICFGGAPLALTTLALSGVARNFAVKPDSGYYRQLHVAVDSTTGPDHNAGFPTAWSTWQVGEATAARAHRYARLIPATAGVLLLTGTVALIARTWPAAVRVPEAAALLQRAMSYPGQRSTNSNLIATATYLAPLSALAGQQIPWAARAPCPYNRGARQCATSTVQLFFAAGRARAVTEGLVFVCMPQRTWSFNAMAGLALTEPRGCGPSGPALSGLGATAGAIAALLPDLAPGSARVIGSDLVAGRACWLVTLGSTGRACVDAATGLLLRLERLGHDHDTAAFTLTQVSYGIDLASELFTNPIPGGHGPLISGLTQPLLNLQAADDQALFYALVPSYLPAGLAAETPTFDQFNDQRQSYSLAQRVRQTYRGRDGHIALVLIETLAGCAWDVTPPHALARSVQINGHSLLAWPGTGGQPALVRIQQDVTAALISSRTLPLETLERVAVGLG